MRTCPACGYPHPGVFCMNVKAKSLRERAICNSMETKDDATRDVSPRGAFLTIDLRVFGQKRVEMKNRRQTALGQKSTPLKCTRKPKKVKRAVGPEPSSHLLSYSGVLQCGLTVARSRGNTRQYRSWAV